MIEADKLIGKWSFIGSQNLIESQWLESRNYIPGLIWIFKPQFRDSQKVVGVIIEINNNEIMDRLAYSYSPIDSILTIEVYTATSKYRGDKSQVDRYIVSHVAGGQRPTIELTIMDGEQQQNPHIRYRLQLS